MKLIEYDRRDVRSTNIEHPMITVTPKSGVFILNKAAVLVTGLKSFDKVTLLQDEEKPGDWYLRLAYNTFGFRLRDDGKGNLKFSARSIAVKMATICLGSQNSHRMMISGEKTEDMWPIITKSAKASGADRKRKGEEAQ